MFSSYGKQAVVAFLKEYLQSNFSISAHLRNCLQDAIIHLEHHDDFSDFNFSESEVDEVFKLFRWFEDHCSRIFSDHRPSDVEILEATDKFFVNIRCAVDKEYLVWPLNDVIEVKSLLRPHTRDHVKWPSKIHLQVKEFPTREMRAWFAIWQHAVTAKTVQPSAKWLKTAKELCTDVRVVLDTHLIEWIRLVLRESPTYCEPFSPQNANAMRGLVWFCVYMQHPDKAKLMMDVVSFGYQKLENKGPRSAIFANAALYVLGEMGVAGVVYLSQLRKKIKYSKAQEQIEKMLVATVPAAAVYENHQRRQAARFGLPHIEPMALMRAVGDVGKIGRNRRRRRLLHSSLARKAGGDEYEEPDQNLDPHVVTI